MYKIGDLIRWRSPLDADYSYGTLLSIDTRGVATIRCIGYYKGLIVVVHTRYIRGIKRGGGGYGSP